MRPHATLRPRLTSNTSHTSVPSPLTVPFTHHAPHLLAEPTRSSDHWRRRRGEKATAEAEESTVFAAVGGARRNGAASPEGLRIEGNARSNSRNPFLHFPPFPPCLIPRSRFVEIQAIWRCVGVPAGGGVLCLPFSVALGSFVAAMVAVLLVWLCLSGDTHWLCLGIGLLFSGLIVAHCFELVFAISSGRVLRMNFKSL